MSASSYSYKIQFKKVIKIEGPFLRILNTIRLYKNENNSVMDYFLAFTVYDKDKL